MPSSNPKMILLFSGKRKSGKDYITDLLFNRLNLSDTVVVIKISGPIKSHWADCKKLNLDDLLSDGSTKEQHRLEMIEWSEEQRSKDYGVFCRQAIAMYNARDKPVWIVSDIRRKTDIVWFRETYNTDKIKTIRIHSSEQTRTSRGWKFNPGVDDMASECDLDDFKEWDYVFENDEDAEKLEKFISNVTEMINEILKESQSL